MRILLHDYSGHPFQVELSRWFASQGHQTLHLYSASFQTPKGRLERAHDDSSFFEIEGLRLKKPFEKYSYLKRRFQEQEYGHLLCKRVKEFSPDIIISSNSPLDAQDLLWKFGKTKKTPCVFWLQDIYSMAITSIMKEKLGFLGGLIGNHYAKLEKSLLKSSKAIVSISPDFSPLLEHWQISADKIHVIPNWAPLAELPVYPKHNDWSIKHGLQDKFVFLYSGTLGLKHNPDLLLRLAQSFQSRPEVVLVVVSEGIGAAWLQSKKQELRISNLLILDYQDFSMMPLVLASADVLLAILEVSAGVYSVPSKVLTYLCAGKPILLSVPQSNLAARTVTESGAGLLAASPEEFLQMAEKILNSATERELMGKNALSYAQSAFDIQRIGHRFSVILRECLQ